MAGGTEALLQVAATGPQRCAPGRPSAVGRASGWRCHGLFRYFQEVFFVESRYFLQSVVSKSDRVCFPNRGGHVFYLVSRSKRLCFGR